MSLFKKQKVKVDWTDQTAPKKRPIQLEVAFELLLKGSAESYSTYNDSRACKNSIQKTLLVNSDSCKESIKEEIAQKLESLYEEVCTAIDSDDLNFSNEYWYNKTVNTISDINPFE